MVLGALEAGGTKMVLAIGNEDGTILDQISIPTQTPEDTMPKMIQYFREKKVEALGIGCFGPIDLNPSSDTYGFIRKTPKLAWRDYNIVGAFSDALKVPVGFDTDVNASALGEATWGSTKGLSDSIYITIGTGIGVGVIQNHKLLHGMMHPEAGHILIMRHPEDTYQGRCPYHTNCLEGFASGPAIEERWKRPAKELKNVPEVWELEAYYIAQGIVNFIMTLSPYRIVLGGGVMHQEQLFPLIRTKVKELLGGYIDTKELQKLDTYLVPASLKGQQGIMGCIKLAIDAME